MKIITELFKFLRLKIAMSNQYYFNITSFFGLLTLWKLVLLCYPELIGLTSELQMSFYMLNSLVCGMITIIVFASSLLWWCYDDEFLHFFATKPVDRKYLYWSKWICVFIPLIVTQLLPLAFVSIELSCSVLMIEVVVFLLLSLQLWLTIFLVSTCSSSSEVGVCVFFLAAGFFGLSLIAVFNVNAEDLKWFDANAFWFLLVAGFGVITAQFFGFRKFLNNYSNIN